MNWNNRQNAREAYKIKVSRAYFLLRDVNMMLRIEVRTFPTLILRSVEMC